jgi:hypothetical protein
MILRCHPLRFLKHNTQTNANKSLDAMSSEYSVLAAGAILGLIFFSDLTEYLGKTKS